MVRRLPLSFGIGRARFVVVIKAPDPALADLSLEDVVRESPLSSLQALEVFIAGPQRGVSIRTEPPTAAATMDANRLLSHRRDVMRIDGYQKNNDGKSRQQHKFHEIAPLEWSSGRFARASAFT